MPDLCLQHSMQFVKLVKLYIKPKLQKSTRYKIFDEYSNSDGFLMENPRTNNHRKINSSRFKKFKGIILRLGYSREGRFLFARNTDVDFGFF